MNKYHLDAQHVIVILHVYIGYYRRAMIVGLDTFFFFFFFIFFFFFFVWVYRLRSRSRYIISVDVAAEEMSLHIFI